MNTVKSIKLSLTVVTAMTLFFMALAPGSRAGENPMADFYNGLAEVIEYNMADPNLCVSESERYIDSHMGALREAAERGKQRSQAYARDYENMNEREMAAAMEDANRAMSDPRMAESMAKSMEAMDRFTAAIQEFSSRHPEEAEEIMDAMSGHSFDDM